MSLTPLQPLDPSSPTFRSDVDTFFRSSMPNFVGEANLLAANLNSIAAGGAYAIPYTWSSYGDLSGPAGGRAGINASLTHQNDTQYLYLDLKSQAGRDESVALSSFTESSSAVRGTLRLEKVGDPTKWIRYNIIGSSVLVTTSLIAIRVAGINSSSADPFAPGDAVLLYFQRTGDKGDTGAPGANAVSQVLSARDVKASGANAQALSGAAWTTRDINAVAFNEIPGASLSANTITLPPGAYEIEASAPAANATYGHRVGLYNLTDGAFHEYGTVERVTDSTGSTSRSIVRTKPAWNSGNRQFQLRHYAAVGGSGGYPLNQAGVSEIYTEVWIKKVG